MLRSWRSPPSPCPTSGGPAWAAPQPPSKCFPFKNLPLPVAQELEESTEPLPYKLWPGMGGCPDPHIPIKAEAHQLFEQMHNDDRWDDCPSLLVSFLFLALHLSLPGTHPGQELPEMSWSSRPLVGSII